MCSFNRLVTGNHLRGLAHISMYMLTNWLRRVVVVAVLFFFDKLFDDDDEKEICKASKSKRKGRSRFWINSEFWDGYCLEAYICLKLRLSTFESNFLETMNVDVELQPESNCKCSFSRIHRTSSTSSSNNNQVVTNIQFAIGCWLFQVLHRPIIKFQNGLKTHEWNICKRRMT